MKPAWKLSAGIEFAGVSRMNTQSRVSAIGVLALANLLCAGFSSEATAARQPTKTRTPTRTPTPTPTPGSSACTIFPPDNPWNTDISSYPVHPNSATYVNFIGATRFLHPDFGTFWNGGPIGIPYVVVPANQPLKPVAFLYADESDPGPYPIPDNPPIEGGPNSTGDRHVLMLGLERCELHELFYAWPPGSSENPYTDRWYAGSGAYFDLRSKIGRASCRE